MANVTMQMSVDSVLMDDTSFEQQLIRVCRNSAAVRQALRETVQATEKLPFEASPNAPCGDGCAEAQKAGNDYAPHSQNRELSHGETQEAAEELKLKEEIQKLTHDKIDPEQRNDDLTEQNKVLSQEKQSLQEQVKELQDEKVRQMSDAESLKHEKDRLEETCRKYQDLEVAWENYQALSEGTRQRLDGLFKKCRNPVELLAFGSQEKESTLTSLWEQCRLSHKASGSEFAQLKALFDFFLTMSLAVEGRDGYQRLEEAMEGRPYKPEQGMQAINEMSQGQVATVVLAGFRESKTGKIIKKCLVEVS